MNKAYKNILKTEKTEYKYVTKRTYIDGRVVYVAQMYNTTSKEYDTMRQAALAVDRFLIDKGKKPVNILKPVD